MPEDDFVESQGSVSQGWLKLLCCSHTISQNSSSSLVLHFTGKDRRIIELFELEGTLESDRVQLSCNEQGHLQLDQVAQSPVQPDLGCLQGQGIHHLSVHSVKCSSASATLSLEKVFLISKLNLSSSLKTFLLVLSQ